MLSCWKSILCIVVPLSLFLALTVMVPEKGIPGEQTVSYLGAMPCTEPLPPDLPGGRFFKLCDGKTKIVVAVGDEYSQGLLPREVAQEVAGILYDKWNERKEAESEGGGRTVVAHAGKPHTGRELMIFESELEKTVEEGHAAFHDPSLGTNGISCDMCHPDASNTHPETYPKFQTQLKKVTLLMDMINWCIENPLEGTKLADDDPRVKAMEAYILAQRKGIALEFGKH